MSRSILLLLLVTSCIGKDKPYAQKLTVHPESSHIMDIEADTLKIDVAKSKINWTASEMWGARRRTGKISFKDGFLLINDNEIVGGDFIVDMETMDITDVPTHEKKARRNLIAHLKSPDFFKVDSYPLSTLKLTGIERLGNDSLKISGNLTIRGITKNIEFIAQQKLDHLIASFTFNRLEWNIAYQGSWADKTLVDKDVELDIDILVW